MFLKNFLPGRARVSPARGIYDVIVAQARQPWFYADLQVPDTVSGRYEMIVLHAFCVFHRLGEQKGKAGAIAQQVCDEMFSDMDRSLRELGVGDMSISKRMRKLAEIFQGRSRAYGLALKDTRPGQGALKEALSRNIYPDGAPEESVNKMADYVRGAVEHLAQTDDADLLSARYRFPDTP